MRENLVGRGCVETTRSLGGIHNPEPSTDRGRRRHHNRSDADKKRAEAAWVKSRSVKPSRFQQEFNTGIRRTK